MYKIEIILDPCCTTRLPESLGPRIPAFATEMSWKLWLASWDLIGNPAVYRNSKEAINIANINQCSIVEHLEFSALI